MSCVGPAPRLFMALVAGSAVMVGGTFVPQYHCRGGQLKICGLERKYQCVSANCPSALCLVAKSAACLPRLPRLPTRGDWPRHRFISSQASGSSAAAGRTDSLIDQVETAIRDMCGIRPGSLLVLSVRCPPVYSTAHQTAIFSPQDPNSKAGMPKCQASIILD